MPVIVLIILLLFLVFLFNYKKKSFKKVFPILVILIVSFVLIRFGQFFVALGTVLLPALIYFLKIIFRNWFLVELFLNNVLKSFLWRNRNNKEKKSTIITKEEAAEILGVSLDASKIEIEKRYKELMKKNHPDLGGSKRIAEMLNAAREVLMK